MAFHDASPLSFRPGTVISAFVLDGRFGLPRGFDYYDDDLTQGDPHEHDPELAGPFPRNAEIGFMVASPGESARRRARATPRS